MGFGADLEAQCNRAKLQGHALVHEVIGQLGLSLIVKTPVGNPSLWQNPKNAPPGYEGGRLRANWNLGVDEPDLSTSEDIDADGGSTLDKIVGKIPVAAAGGVYFLTNSLPYAKAIEDGHSTQAPVGMVTLTVIEFSAMVSEAAIKVAAINGNSFANEIGA